MASRVMNSQETKLPPFNTDAEEALIGSLVIDGDVMRQVYRYLKPQDFYHDNNRAYYQACCNLYERREAINQVTIASEMKRQGTLDKSGGTAKLYHYESVCPTSCDAEYYADLIKRASVSRQIVSTGDRIAAIGYEDNPDTNAAISLIADEVNKIKKTSLISKEIFTPKDMADDIYDFVVNYDKPIQSILTDYSHLDKVATGFQKGELTIIGARAKTGKTQLMLDISENIARRQSKVLFISAEMPRRQINERKMSRYLGLSIADLRNKTAPRDTINKLYDLSGVVATTPIHYLCKGTGLAEIEREVDAMAEKDGIDIVFVDYLQKLNDCWGDKDNMDVRVGRVSNTLKLLAMDYNIPVVAAAQLNRANELREEKRPTISDLRYSGNIEQDADNIWLLFRDLAENPNNLEIKIISRQLGFLGNIDLYFNDSLKRYVNAAV